MSVTRSANQTHETPFSDSCLSASIRKLVSRITPIISPTALVADSLKLPQCHKVSNLDRKLILNFYSLIKT
jgi:hypothetical protein